MNNNSFNINYTGTRGSTMSLFTWKHDTRKHLFDMLNTFARIDNYMCLSWYCTCTPFIHVKYTAIHIKDTTQ